MPPPFPQSIKRKKKKDTSSWQPVHSSSKVKSLLEFLIDNCIEIFGENMPAHSSITSDDSLEHTDSSGTECALDLWFGKTLSQSTSPYQQCEVPLAVEISYLLKSPNQSRLQSAEKWANSKNLALKYTWPFFLAYRFSLQPFFYVSD